MNSSTSSIYIIIVSILIYPIHSLSPEDRCSSCLRLFTLVKSRLPDLDQVNTEQFNQVLKTACMDVLSRHKSACAGLIAIHGNSIYTQIKQTKALDGHRECTNAMLCD